MAPESLLKQEYGLEVDIWALGCTVYEMITGNPYGNHQIRNQILRIPNYLGRQKIS
uniref:Protein kinase n=1 Tax=Solanum tuberosum TaxID=4113 RepID=M1CJA3_SOLTU